VGVGPRQLPVTSQQRSVQGFRERYVCGIVRGKRIVHGPYASQQRLVGMPNAREVFVARTDMLGRGLTAGFTLLFAPVLAVRLRRRRPP